MAPVTNLYGERLSTTPSTSAPSFCCKPNTHKSDQASELFSNPLEPIKWFRSCSFLFLFSHRRHSLLTHLPVVQKCRERGTKGSRQSSRRWRSSWGRAGYPLKEEDVSWEWLRGIRMTKRCGRSCCSAQATPICRTPEARGGAEGGKAKIRRCDWHKSIIRDADFREGRWRHQEGAVGAC